MNKHIVWHIMPDVSDIQMCGPHTCGQWEAVFFFDKVLPNGDVAIIEVNNGYDMDGNQLRDKVRRYDSNGEVMRISIPGMSSFTLATVIESDESECND